MESLGSVNILHNYKKNELFCNLAILTILFFLNCFMGELSYVAFSFLFVIVMIADMANGFTYIVYTIPFCMVGGDISGYLYIALILIFMIKSYVKMLFIDKLKIQKKFIITVVMFTIYMLLPFGGINCYNSQLFLKNVLVLSVIFFLYLVTKYPKQFRLKINVNICAVGLLISVIFMGTYFISDHLQDITNLFYVDDYIRFQALLTNPNILAIVCEICLSILVYFFLSIKISWVEVVSFVIFTVLGFSTLSKTFFILFAVMLTFLIVFLLRKRPFIGLCLISLFCLLIIVIVIFKPDIFNTYFGRFVNFASKASGENDFYTAMNFLTTGRYGLCVTYIQYMMQYPYILFFGATLGTGQLAGNSPHNIYISSLYQFGLVGLTLYITIFVLIFKDFKKNNPLLISKWVVVPIIIMSMMLCVEEFFMFIYA